MVEGFGDWAVARTVKLDLSLMQKILRWALIGVGDAMVNLGGVMGNALYLPAARCVDLDHLDFSAIEAGKIGL